MKERFLAEWLEKVLSWKDYKVQTGQHPSRGRKEGAEAEWQSPRDECRGHIWKPVTEMRRLGGNLLSLNEWTHVVLVTPKI